MKVAAAALALATWAFVCMIFGLFTAADHDDISDGFANSFAGHTTRDCRDIPASAMPSLAALETSRDEAHTRAVHIFSDFSQGQSSNNVPALVVYGSERPFLCAPTIQAFLDGVMDDVISVE